jgi:hypothetical protein
VLSVGREWITVCVLSVGREWITVCVLSVGREWITVCVLSAEGTECDYTQTRSTTYLHL